MAPKAPMIHLVNSSLPAFPITQLSAAQPWKLLSSDSPGLFPCHSSLTYCSWGLEQTSATRPPASLLTPAPPSVHSCDATSHGFPFPVPRPHRCPQGPYFSFKALKTVVITLPLTDSLIPKLSLQLDCQLLEGRTHLCDSVTNTLC